MFSFHLCFGWIVGIKGFFWGDWEFLLGGFWFPFNTAHKVFLYYHLFLKIFFCLYSDDRMTWWDDMMTWEKKERCLDVLLTWLQFTLSLSFPKWETQNYTTDMACSTRLHVSWLTVLLGNRHICFGTITPFCLSLIGVVILGFCKRAVNRHYHDHLLLPKRIRVYFGVMRNLILTL